MVLQQQMLLPHYAGFTSQKALPKYDTQSPRSVADARVRPCYWTSQVLSVELWGATLLPPAQHCQPLLSPAAARQLRLALGPHLPLTLLPRRPEHLLLEPLL
jgi:hypothetical protein